MTHYFSGMDINQTIIEYLAQGADILAQNPAIGSVSFSFSYSEREEKALNEWGFANDKYPLTGHASRRFQTDNGDIYFNLTKKEES